ncbi:uncharacterized protein I206_104304 [Kwoniella pini CBS 10737]|uniref:Peptidyl-prolyl cis-trans isomerase n=1 Tax=Kwoniella pini CBS 10737 TaxID=1296096 RepID=A0A1B9I251_9TREE|nr:uncharacterized protein I206_04119 [Kwoniella pini CBS 10737]OCF49597.1 hypothetical protein I206_04119 [Kwoniella pini CBS 10737]
MSETQTGWMKIGYGDMDQYELELKQWEYNQSILEQNYQIYGLPSKLEDLNEEQIEILKDLIKHSSSSSSSLMGEVKNKKPISPIFEDKLEIELFVKECPITCKNFIELLKGEETGRKSKFFKNSNENSNSNFKELKYKGNKFHRLIKNFIIQGGDIIKENGTSGESIYGLKFNDEKNGLNKFKFNFGTLAMSSNNSKNSNSSQFFICLISNSNDNDSELIKKEKEKEKKFNKLNGKYVIFGQIKNEKSLNLLKKLNELIECNEKEEIVNGICWIENCGVL